ncbi:IclR family transcriptional regulator C-terminal domain-containing protein [Kribbella sp. NBC_00889]|uniref:IclR family transcriptional regulator domain-containing protein n=1 Tax=Kribbella sp. NBC_00889 TaxID=2975974 RepID=UPI00386499BE
MTFVLRDVTLRDGLQLTGKPLPVARKVEIVRSLLALGVPALEIGSMARPDLVPAMDGTLDVIRELTPAELEKCWIWVATPRHVARAAEAGARNFQYCLSASDKHNQANLGRSTADSLAALPEALELAADVSGEVQLCIATAFTCPFEGEVPPGRVLDIVLDPRTDGTSDVVLCDTLGQAIPEQVHHLVGRTAAVDDRLIVYHGHDTWGLGVANSLAAIDRQGDQLRVGVKMAYWAAPAVKGVDVLDLIVPLLRQLRDATGETAAFFRAEQGHRVCVALAETNHALRREMHVGKMMPLHAGSASRVLLAWDDELAKSVLAQPLGSITDSTITSADELAAVIKQTRADGYAITIGEREQGASGLSTPVFKANGELAGCLTISGPTIRMPLDRCLDWLDLLVESAEHATRLLGGRFPTTI